MAEEVRLDADGEVGGFWKTIVERGIGEHHVRFKFMFRAERETAVGCHGKVPSGSQVKELIGKEKRSQSRRKWKDLVWWFWLKQMSHCTKGEVWM